MKCLYCKGTDFFEGPSGGGSQNVLCANDKCRHWFNVTPFGLEDLHRVEPSNEEKLAEQHQQEIVEKNATAHFYNEGRSFYQKGDSSLKCLSSPLYGNYAEPHENVLRLCGFLDALKEDISNNSLNSKENQNV